MYKKLVVALAVALMMLASIATFAQADEAVLSVPQTKELAAARYQTSQDVLFPVENTVTGNIDAWKIESSASVAVYLSGGECVDYIASSTSFSGNTASTQLANDEDWGRTQITGQATMITYAATIYIGQCGPITSYVATVTTQPGTNLNCRKGPGGTYNVLGILASGSQHNVQARNTAGTYVYFINGAPMGCWASFEYLTLPEGVDVMSLPDVEVESPNPSVG